MGEVYTHLVPARWKEELSRGSRTKNGRLRALGEIIFRIFHGRRRRMYIHIHTPARAPISARKARKAEKHGRRVFQFFRSERERTERAPFSTRTRFLFAARKRKGSAVCISAAFVKLAIDYAALLNFAQDFAGSLAAAVSISSLRAEKGREVYARFWLRDPAAPIKRVRIL